MPQQPVPADPGPEEDLAWLDRDPATAQEREEWLDRVCEHDEPPEEEEYEDFAPLTAEELAEISQAAADELLAVEAATTGRRCPGLPGTRAALDEGTVSLYKARLIATATALLDPAEARAAEAEVLDRAARLTPAGLRAAIARAVMEVAPEKAKERREQAAKDAWVERWAEDSGNAALMGCELPPAEVLAADQRITAWAKELGKAGLEGDMDQLRARAYLDLLLAKDSRPRRPATPGGDGDAGPGNPDGHGGPADGPVPAGFAGRVALTVPLATLTGLADRPGDLSGLGPVDPWLARDLATAAAHNPTSTWCLTVTDGKGHAVAHGCARPEPKSRRKRAGPIGADLHHRTHPIPHLTRSTAASPTLPPWPAAKVSMVFELPSSTTSSREYRALV